MEELSCLDKLNFAYADTVIAIMYAGEFFDDPKYVRDVIASFDNLTTVARECGSQMIEETAIKASLSWRDKLEGMITNIPVVPNVDIKNIAGAPKEIEVVKEPDEGSHDFSDRIYYED